MGKARLSKATGKRARSSSEEEVSKLIKKRFALSASFSLWESISWLKAYLLAIFFFFAQERGLAQQTIKSYFSKVSSISLHVCLG